VEKGLLRWRKPRQSWLKKQERQGYKWKTEAKRRFVALSSHPREES
jgi:hypothetical protein